MPDLNELSRDQLIKLIEVYAKNWLAHDGCWFLAVEQRFGMETAIEMDARSWECFSPVEARRVMEVFDIPQGAGLEGLEKALAYRLYAQLNHQEAVRIEPDVMEFRMLECRVQSARRRKGLPDFPCKSVGIVEYSQFAQTVDSRITTECVACPPDQVDGAACIWRFSLRE